MKEENTKTALYLDDTDNFAKFNDVIKYKASDSTLQKQYEIIMSALKYPKYYNPEPEDYL